MYYLSQLDLFTPMKIKQYLPDANTIPDAGGEYRVSNQRIVTKFSLSRSIDRSFEWPNNRGVGPVVYARIVGKKMAQTMEPEATPRH